MRTQKILVAAATLAVSLASSMAQVYSQNIVGYINLTVQPGYNMVANQLNNGSGSNTLNQVFPSVPDGSKVFKFVPANGNFNVDVFVAVPAPPDFPTVGWYDDSSGAPSSTQVSPGEGFFFYSPSLTTITLVGSVKTGTNTVNLVPGYNMVSSVTPESYELTGTNFPAADGMKYFAYNTVNHNFDVGVYVGSPNPPDFPTVGWYDDNSGAPITVKPSVGQGFFINYFSAFSWTRAFNP